MIVVLLETQLSKGAKRKRVADIDEGAILVCRKWMEESAWLHIDSACSSKRQLTNFVGRIVDVNDEEMWIESFWGVLGVRLSIGLQAVRLQYSDTREAPQKSRPQIEELAKSGIIIESEFGELVFIVELQSEHSLQALPNRG